MEFQTDSSGIKSLAGFAFQIKVFCNLCSKLSEGQKLEFESIDDIALNKTAKPENLDNVNGQILSSSYDAIQVKHTTLTNSLAEKVLMNWIQIEDSSINIKKYILITDKKYNNLDLIKSLDINEFIKKVNQSDRRSDANITKVKSILNNKSEPEQKKFIFHIINEKYSFKNLEIDKELINNYKDKFLKSANEVVFYQRLKAFLEHITSEILKAVNSSESFSLTYEDFQKIENDIMFRFTEKHSLPLYNDFKNIHPIKLKDTLIANSREYKQLMYCGLREEVLKDYLMHAQYYRKFRMNNIDVCLKSKCDDIETTAYENFEEVLDDLQANNEDTPRNRLKHTTKADNSYADNTQIRNGSCIYLTSDNVDQNIQISWKDE